MDDNIEDRLRKDGAEWRKRLPASADPSSPAAATQVRRRRWILTVAAAAAVVAVLIVTISLTGRASRTSPSVGQRPAVTLGGSSALPSSRIDESASPPSTRERASSSTPPRSTDATASRQPSSTGAATATVTPIPVTGQKVTDPLTAPRRLITTITSAPTSVITDSAASNESVSMPWKLLAINEPGTKLQIKYAEGDGYCVKPRGIVVAETNGSVTITPVSMRTSTDEYCPAMLVTHYAVITLSAPLAQRALIHPPVAKDWSAPRLLVGP